MQIRNINNEEMLREDLQRCLVEREKWRQAVEESKEFLEISESFLASWEKEIAAAEDALSKF